MITTSDDRAAGKLRLLRNYGQRVKYHHAVPGTNSRLDTLQAAVLSIKLPHLDGWNAARRAARATRMRRGSADTCRRRSPRRTSSTSITST